MVRTRPLILSLGLGAAVAICLTLPLFGQESRRFNRIPIHKKPAPEQPSVLSLSPQQLPPLPSRTEVETAVQDLAQSYATENLRELLADEFPNKEELLDTLRTVQQDAATIQLDVESIEVVQVGPWQEAAAEPQGDFVSITLHSTAVVDVRTRLSFDDLRTGMRVVRDVGHGEWQVRFSAKVFTHSREEVGR